ncbi:major tail protein [Enterococcus faecalis]|uniref:major tail protein n=2 Tax=Enterococcus faecalis TaxID=1351 RepID=UPI000CF0BBA3|nr:major tail protein [Enterococcus faecalis]EGO5142115.1 phage tail protein [Enterococcus faecalis]EGO6012468.1 phage tail protein [Enterococcus faecalis]EGO6585853.1 phage tail protein [Enterococcus faecalis]EGO7698016.1 phage tail protein [Enterococcus faecalis]EGO8254967.1 phage tail protein [Enterococcus faecalis]
MQTYGFSRITIQQLDNELKPVAGKKHIIDGKPKEGAAASFEITGLTKEPSKAFGSNIAYYVARKGHGDIAANLGILDVPSATEHEMLGHKKASEESKVYHIGEDTEPPYYAVLIESEDLYGEKLGFGMYAGTFSLDGVKGETLNDDDFTPEPGEYVYSAVSRQINGKKVTVGFADNSEALAELTTELFGEETPAPEK